MVLQFHSNPKPQNPTFNWVLDMLIVPLCQSKNKGHLSTGMPRSQVTGSSRAERRTWPLGRREVAGAIWGSLKSLTSRSHRIGLEPTASSPVSNLKSFQSTSKHTVCTRKTFNDKFTNTEYCFKNIKQEAHINFP